jgi:hypothetical protein
VIMGGEEKNRGETKRMIGICEIYFIYLLI